MDRFFDKNERIMSEGTVVFNVVEEVGEINKTLAAILDILVLVERRISEHRTRLDRIEERQTVLHRYGVGR